jgi:hypothetical protein
MNVDLKMGAVRLREECVAVPLQERPKRREEAMAVARLINPEQFRRRNAPPKPQGTGVFRFEE